MTIPRGRVSETVVWVSAEVRCQGPSSLSNWCGARVLANGVELQPDEGADNGDHFHWDSANPDPRRKRALAFHRAGTVTCPDNSGCDVTVTVQARNNTPASQLWVDDLAVRGELNTYPS
ncbi:hypothetical protein AB0I81_55940 [Nonomuraea sp. NPDC050404]|uniref:hypothetical protein n=1 Tax=Nonomuraea sp. NPDC050404 TaxID=3155783 RepID=UPI0033EA1734